MTARAEKDLRTLPAQDQAAVRKAIDALRLDPLSVDLKKLAGARNEWRIRVRTWRVRLSQQGVLPTLIESCHAGCLPRLTAPVRT
jgi:mRNA-degrading endonuclease RelE of RelBE toxin-antitoxin system